MSAPVLHLFRRRPSTLEDGVATAMQGFETALFLIALKRFPHALASCVSATESILRDSSKSRARLKDLLPESPLTAILSPGLEPRQIGELRKARNKIVHEGFGAQDDSKSAALLLRTGIPLLEHYFSRIHQFELINGLIEEFGTHLGVAKTVYQRRCASANIDDINGGDFTYCFRSFGHLMKERIRLAETPEWIHEAVNHADGTGMRWEVLRKIKDSSERAFNCGYSFDCPVCDEFDSTIADLDPADLERGIVRPTRLVCVDCEFIVAPEHEFLAEELLRSQATTKREAILKDFAVPRHT